jgi:hypothetical protein
MVQTVNERLLDHAISHAVDLTKYSNGVVRRMIALLNKADPDLVSQIAAALERLPASSFTVGQMESVLGSVRSINTAAYAQVFQALPKEMEALAGYEVGYQADLLAHVVPAPVLVQFPLAQVSPHQVYAAALARPFQGGLLADWAKSVDANRMTAIRSAIRLGYVEGQTTDQIVRRIRGTRAAQYSDGILEGSRKGLGAIVRTALSHTAQTAREQVYAANGDIIKALAWVSVLDNRTTSQCIVRDGKTYTADAAHKPIGHAIPWLQGPGRLHFCCRSSDVPVTKSYRELGIDIEELPPAQRASMDGAVPAQTTYLDWLGRQSAARQDDILGPTRGKLMREGVAPSALFSNRGDLLSLDQLRARDASVFNRAGL